jgi:hypothetical protein
MRKLLVAVLAGGLFALGCGGTTTSSKAPTTKAGMPPPGSTPGKPSMPPGGKGDKEAMPPKGETPPTPPKGEAPPPPKGDEKKPDEKKPDEKKPDEKKP